MLGQLAVQCVGGVRLFQRRAITGDGLLDFRKHAGLQPVELCCRRRAPRFRLGNRPLIVVEQRQFQRKSQAPLVVALIVFVAGIQMQVGILLGDFQLQRGLAGRVFGQRPENVGAVDQRLPPRGGIRHVGGKLLEAIEIQGDALERGGRQAQRFRQLNAGRRRLLFGILQCEPRLIQRHAGLRDFKRRNRAGLALRFQQPHAFGLRRFLFLEQRHAFTGGVKREQIFPHPAAHLPRGGRQFAPRRVRKMRRLRQPITAFARRLNRNVQTRRDDPRRRHPGRGAIGHVRAHGGIGPRARRDARRLRVRQLRPRQIQLGIVIIGDQRKAVEIPDGGRRRGGGQIRGEKGVQPGIGQGTALKVRARLLRRERLVVKMRAAHQPQHTRAGQHTKNDS